MTIQPSKQFYNTAISNKFKVSFSNIPNLIKYNDIGSLYSRFVHSLSLPEYGLKYIEQRIAGSVQLQPISQKNDDLAELSIEFQLDENFLNYYNLSLFIKQLRHGDNMRGKEFLYQNIIDSIDVIRLDNEAREIKTVSFKNCMLVNLSPLDLEFGKADIPTFQADFKYQEFYIVNPST